MDSRFDKTEAVTLIVGEEKHEMLIHANSISIYSSFFDDELEKECSEGMHSINIPFGDRKTMAHYLEFAYGGYQPNALPSAFITSEMVEMFPNGVNKTVDLANLYALGVRLLNENLRNAVNGEFIRLSELGIYPDRDTISIIYEGTDQGDSTRELMVDIYVGWAKRDWLDTEANPAFLLDLAKVSIRKAEQSLSPTTYRGDACELTDEDYEN